MLQSCSGFARPCQASCHFPRANQVREFVQGRAKSGSAAGHGLSELAPSAEAADDAASSTGVDIVGAHETRAKGNGDLQQLPANRGAAVSVAARAMPWAGAR